MKVVVGLGNPGPEYERTRHNIGFRVLDEVAARQKAAEPRRQWKALVQEARVADDLLLLVRPQTYMNLSGESVLALLDEMEAEPAGLLVVTDDVALPLGRMRLRGRGSPGGHNGLASVEQALATDAYDRLRIGVGPGEAANVPGAVLVDYVLGAFDAEDEKALTEIVPAATEAVLCWATEGLEKAQARYNGWRPAGDEDRRTERNSGDAQPG